MTSTNPHPIAERLLPDMPPPEIVASYACLRDAMRAGANPEAWVRISPTEARHIKGALDELIARAQATDTPTEGDK